MWYKILQLVLYLTAIFLLCRLLDVLVWFETGIASTAIIDPFTLNIPQLQHLLDIRGISYTGIVEKQELSLLVRLSGHIQQTDLLESEAKSTSSSSIEEKPYYFTSESNFNEEVEDTKDSVWLLQVKTDDEAISDFNWNETVYKFLPFGVRTGIFNCSLDKIFCKRKGWNSSRIILVLPRGKRVKDSTITYTFNNMPISPQAILDSVRTKMSFQVHSIESIDTFLKEWENTTNFKECQSNVRVVLISELEEPPLFFSALSFKFSGRVTFGKWQVTKREINSEKFRKRFEGEDLPLYVIITPEQTIYYGNRQREHLNFESLHMFIMFLRPETNETFLFTLAALNLFLLLDMFCINTRGIYKDIMIFIWKLVKYNALFLSCWLCILGMFQFPIVNEVQEILLTALRILTYSQISSNFIYAWKLFRTHTIFLFCSIVLYSFLSAIIRKKFHLLHDDSLESTTSNWLSSLDAVLSNCFFRSTTIRQLDPDIEEGVELIIGRLAMPNLWLQPVINPDYIKDLPLWRYRGWSEDDILSEESNSESEEQTDIEITSPSSSGEEDPNPLNCCNTINNQTTWRRRAPSPPCCTKNRGRIREFFGNVRKIMRNRCQIYITNETTEESSLNNVCERLSNTSISECQREDSEENLVVAPSGILPCKECAICLERYKWKVVLCGLPCGHNYHQNCIMLWLSRDNHQCPVCRWPTYKKKPKEQASVT